MTDCKDCMLLLSREFKDCQKALAAIGDETRQQIIITLLESDTHGSRVGEITLKTHLSRSAVSHHLQILKNAGIIEMRREGTRNYYFIKAADNPWNKILKLVTHINDILLSMPEEEKRQFNRTEL